MRTTKHLKTRLLTLLLTLFSLSSICQEIENFNNDYLLWELDLGVAMFEPQEDYEYIYIPINLSMEKDTLILYPPQAFIVIDKNTGCPQWGYRSVDPYVSFIGKNNNTIYLYTSNGRVAPFTGTPRWHIAAIDAEEKKGLWSILSEQQPTPEELRLGTIFQAYGGIHHFIFKATSPEQPLYEGEITSSIMALDFEKGEVLWSESLADYGEPYDYENNHDNELIRMMSFQQGWTSKYIIGNVLFLVVHRSIVAIDIDSGKRLWIYDNNEYVGFEEVLPLVQGDALIYDGIEVFSLNITNGEKLWVHADTTGYNRLVNLFDNNLLVEQKKNGDLFTYRLSCINSTNGLKKWEQQLVGRILKADVSDNQLIVETEKNFYIIDFYDGRILEQIPRYDNTRRFSNSRTLVSTIDERTLLVTRNARQLDTIKLSAPVKEIYELSNTLLYYLENGVLIALSKEGNPNQTSPFFSAQELIKNLPITELPKEKKVSFDRSKKMKLKGEGNKRLGLMYEWGRSMLCKDGTKSCTEEASFSSYGLSYRVYLNNYSAIEPELVYTNRNAGGNLIFTSSGNLTGERYEYNLDYLYLNATYAFGTSFRKRVRIELLGGLSYGVNLNSKYSIHRMNGRIDEFPFKGANDIGLIGGYGLERRPQNGLGFFAQFKVYWGLNQIVNGDWPSQSANFSLGRNRAYGISFGLIL